MLEFARELIPQFVAFFVGSLLIHLLCGPVFKARPNPKKLKDLERFSPEEQVRILTALSRQLKYHWRLILSLAFACLVMSFGATIFRDLFSEWITILTTAIAMSFGILLFNWIFNRIVHAELERRIHSSKGEEAFRQIFSIDE